LEQGQPLVEEATFFSIQSFDIIEVDSKLQLVILPRFETFDDILKALLGFGTTMVPFNPHLTVQQDSPNFATDYDRQCLIENPRMAKNQASSAAFDDLFGSPDVIVVAQTFPIRKVLYFLAIWLKLPWWEHFSNSPVAAWFVKPNGTPSTRGNEI
jgi:hypothetical protein